MPTRKKGHKKEPHLGQLISIGKGERHANNFNVLWNYHSYV
ncbi:hypothetical protein SELSPUOL_02171 [Selenomonas sputigena ATCC 35185]|uniref:Uncharacterized protein n=1 Tax=Selenomonas sputigena (strain ATCC 35185 / DSM 20758 / CCUG 44933 / VPI D19B-28) TaxID=546271 RepID=C9LXG3_SELS3|nr:hypothetical protein SELSPUOL_02171 [Selenomonas sputigena ATCC 35185]